MFIPSVRTCSWFPGFEILYKYLTNVNTWIYTIFWCQPICIRKIVNLRKMAPIATGCNYLWNVTFSAVINWIIHSIGKWNGLFCVSELRSVITQQLWYMGIMKYAFLNIETWSEDCKTYYDGILVKQYPSSPKMYVMGVEPVVSYWTKMRKFCPMCIYFRVSMVKHC